MRLKREIKCVLCTETMRFQYLSTKRWFEKFWSEILSVKDSSRPIRPTEIDTDKIKVLVNENPHFTVRDIVDDSQNSHKNVLYHIRKIDQVNRLDAWVPHGPKSTDWDPTGASNRDLQFVDWMNLLICWFVDWIQNSCL